VEELKDLMASYDGSLVLPLSPSSAAPHTNQAGFDQNEAKEDGFEPILSVMVDPMIQACSAWSDALPTAFQRATLMVNCIQEILIALQLYGSFTRYRSELIQARMEVHLDILATEEVSDNVMRDVSTFIISISTMI
jgi:hypothetical protein